MSAQHFAAAWEQLPLGVQQCILVLSGPSTRRVSKAWNAAFDATNDTLCFRRVYYSEQSLEAAATAAATRVVKNSPSLTAVNFINCDVDSPFTLTKMLEAGAALGLATRLRKLTGMQVNSDCAVQQLQALQQCTGLTHLDINGGEPEDWLPEEGHLAAVKLTAALQGMHRLVRLQISGFQLQFKGSAAALASALQPLTQLQHLHVWCSGLGEAGVAALVPALSAMPGLQTLNVSYNSLEGPAGAEALCGLLGAVPRLLHLDVSGSELGAEGAALLAPVLRGMTCLQTLYLNDTSIGNGGMAMFAPALAVLPYLHTLGVSCSGLESRAMSALQPVLAGEGSPLRKLDIAHNRLVLEGARALAEGLSTSAQLRELSLYDTDLRQGGWVVLAPALSCLAPSLQLLELGSMDVAGSAALAPALQQLTGLTCLRAKSLSTSATMVTIIPALLGMRQLQMLDLSYSGMSVEGIAAFAAVLPAFAGSLTHLTLSNCSLDVQAAANALAPALAQATCLVELNLDNNRLEPFGAEWLVPVLSCLPHLRKVDLSLCDLGAQGCMAVAQAVKERDGTVLVLRGNGVSEGGAFQKALLSIPGVHVHLES